jgi:hypothetical protein
MPLSSIIKSGGFGIISLTPVKMKEQVYTGFAVRDITEEKKLRD